MFKKVLFNKKKFSRIASVALIAAGAFATMVENVPANAASATPLQITGWNFPQLPSYNMFAPNFINAQPISNLPLAYAIHPQMNWVPMLASSWSITSKRMVINLRANAKWSDGTAFTSKDVLTTFELAGALGWGTLTGISNISTPNPHQVILTLVKGADQQQILTNILGSYFVPASQYGKFVTPTLLKDVLLSSQSTPATPVSTSIINAETSVKTALLKFNPASYVGTGPFDFKSTTTNMTIFTKNNYFYDANKIHVQQINVPQSQSSSQQTAYLLNGSTDYSWSGEPQNILSTYLSRPNNLLHLAWDWSEFDWYLNSKVYPLNMVAVRQALAYAIDRTKTSIIGDGPNGVLPVKTITGLQYGVQKQWIPASVLKTLNPYNYSTAKATQLLKSTGFKLENNKWMMPNGKPFTLTMISPAGYTDAQLDEEAVANSLTQFGIQTTASSVEQPGFWTQQNKGQYQISWGWGGWWVFNPVQTYYDSLVNQNYTPNQVGYTGMGFGPSVAVPGLGKVNITQNLTEDLRIQSHAKIQKLAIDYAKLVNQQLPFIPFADKRVEVEYSTAHYTNWPAKNSYLWNQIGGNAQGGLMLMMMNGFVTPK